MPSLALTAATLVAALIPVRAHDAKAFADAERGDLRRWQWFDTLKQPGNGKWCCHMTDCHQTEARQLPDGSWTAVASDYAGERWVAIPYDKVVKRRRGSLHLQQSRQRSRTGHVEGTIFCFV